MPVKNQTNSPKSPATKPWGVTAICVALVLSACAETRLAMHAAKQFSPQPNISKGHYKIGNPYQIKGVWYYPSVNYRYSETGIASWYGQQFHKKRTANGQTFDMNAITAAHRTLPLPSMVRVTNLRNGRSLKVLVNDRGPFARGRIIDLSRRSAQLLGFERAGTARVKVEIVPDESRRLALLAQGKISNVAAAKPHPVRVAALPGDNGASREQPRRPVSAHRSAAEATSLPIEPPAVTKVPVTGKTQLFVQAGAFVRRDLALKTKKSLATVGPTRVVETSIGARRFFRVRVGPVSTIRDGDRILDRVVDIGYPDARLVVD